MAIEILSIGNELLSGFTINSNAAVIAQKLLPQGFSIDRVTLLPDDPLPLKAGIEEALKRSSFIITTGGLGPTGDDLTREIVAEIFETPLVYDETVAADLMQRFTPNLPTLKDQAMVPKGAHILLNPIGTAPGFILGNRLIVLPGVPAQMEALLDPVIPFLHKHCPRKHYVKSLYFCQLSEQTVDPLLRTLEKENPGIQIGICPSYGFLSVYIHAKDPQELDPIADKIIQAYAPYYFSTTSKYIESALQEWMISHHQTLACAESCTGGHLAARITAISGASDYFLGSIVSYSNALKKAALHVNPQSLHSHGAVSEVVVKEMAQGVLTLTGADYALAVSGIAGPTGGTPEKPVGTVWGAVATRDQVFTGQFLAKGGGKRELVIEYSATFLLSTLWRYLKHNHRPFT